MTTQRINWSELDQKYWIKDTDGEALWFESSLDAKARALKVALEQAALDERAAIVAWLRDQDGHGYDTMRADCIENGEHHREK